MTCCNSAHSGELSENTGQRYQYMRNLDACSRSKLKEATLRISRTKVQRTIPVLPTLGKVYSLSNLLGASAAYAELLARNCGRQQQQLFQLQKHVFLRRLRGTGERPGSGEDAPTQETKVGPQACTVPGPVSLIQSILKATSLRGHMVPGI